LRTDRLLHEGREPADPAAPAGPTKPAQALPFPLSRELLERGRERFDIFCSPCHGRTGQGDGMIVRRGFRPAKSLHAIEVRAAPVGHTFEVVTNGLGAMPAHGAQIPVLDRWAIVAYVRALQLSQHATLEDVPTAERARLEAEHASGAGTPRTPGEAPARGGSP
jgi:mono/diheme cytochrome c family protein